MNVIQLIILSVDANGHIVSPIFHEISQDVFKKIKSNSNFLFVDPQGFYVKKILKIILF